MTPKQFRQLRVRLGLSVGDVAQLLGMSSTRNVRRWIDGSAPIPPGVAQRLHEMDRSDEQ